MLNPRCPDCDIEMLYDGNAHACPICGRHATQSYCAPMYIQRNYVASNLRETLLKARELLIEIAEDCPDHKVIISKAYHDAGEMLEGME